jgi:flagellar secretion chaperone FliS
MTLAAQSRIHIPVTLLMDGALERLDAAREYGWEDEPGQMHCRQSAVLILGELRAELDLHRGGAIAANVAELYDYMCRRLQTADPENGIAALHEVSHLLDALRSAWAFMPAEVRSASRN